MLISNYGEFKSDRETQKLKNCVTSTVGSERHKYI